MKIFLIFRNAFSLSRLRDSSLPEGAYLKHRFGERNVDLLNQYFRYEFRVWNSKSFNPAIAKMSVKAGSLREVAKRRERNE